MIVMLPFKLRPAFKDYIWGGRKLKTDFHKQTPLEPVAESWELSAHPDGDSVIATGELAGGSFSAFVREHPSLLGSHCAGMDEFPVLLKLIDAKTSLSIQVHPDDDYARRVEHEQGKTEMWYILDCEPDAFLYFGFSREASAGEMRRKIEDNTLAELLYKAPVKKGDVFFIAAGTIHAIGAGILLAEIQQNSNTTYRVYDFGRLGADGKPRALHVDKALEVTARHPADRSAPGAAILETNPEFTLRRLASCNYFTAESLTLSGRYLRRLDGGSFAGVLCADGDAELICGEQILPLAKGDTCFVPSDAGEFSLKGTGEFLFTTI